MNKKIRKTEKQLSFESLWNDPQEEKKADENDVKMPSSAVKNSLLQTSLVDDFEVFISYINEHVIQLTKTKEYISRKHLPIMNEQMVVKAEGSTPYTEQEFYPLIHFFYTLALSGRLVEKVPFKAGQYKLKTTDRLPMYSTLTDVEKYFFLLETFWVDVSWAELEDKSFSSIVYELPEVFYNLNRIVAEQSSITNNSTSGSGEMAISQMSRWHYFLLYFEWFGFWVCEEDKKRKEQRGTKSSYYARSITLTDFGLNIMPILIQSRNLSIWNIAERRENGDFNALPGSPLSGGLGGYLANEGFALAILSAEEDQSAQLFCQPFTGLFPQGKLANTLPRNRNLFVDGLYTFKVSLAGSSTVWRKVTLAAAHSMDDLHQIILEAFQFGNDHLYSFFMNGKLWSDNCIVSPHDDAGHADATQVQIGKMSFIRGQRFLYLFDYGDEWKFVVEVDQIDEGSEKLASPFVKEIRGEGPEQYGDFY